MPTVGDSSDKEEDSALPASRSEQSKEGLTLKGSISSADTKSMKDVTTTYSDSYSQEDGYSLIHERSSETTDGKQKDSTSVTYSSSPDGTKTISSKTSSTKDDEIEVSSEHSLTHSKEIGTSYTKTRSSETTDGKQRDGTSVTASQLADGKKSISAEHSSTETRDDEKTGYFKSILAIFTRERSFFQIST